MFDERKIRETTPQLFISKGVISPNSSNRGNRSQVDPTFDMLKWVNNVLYTNGLINVPDPCCADFVQNFTPGETLFTLNVPLVEDHTPVAINATATATAAQIASGYITSTSAAAVTLTLPLATDLATALGATQGTIFRFAVDNSAGANTVTVAVNTGITVGTQAITGGNTLTISTANSVGIFELAFTSATTAIIRRVF